MIYTHFSCDNRVDLLAAKLTTHRNEYVRSRFKSLPFFLSIQYKYYFAMKKFNIDQQFYVQLTHLGMQVLMAHYSPEEMEDLLNQRQVKFHSEYWYRFTLSQFCLVFFSFTPSEYIGENIIFDEMDLSDANPQ